MPDVPAERTIVTARLRLRPPCRADAEAIFEEYASDAEITRYLPWGPHTHLDGVRAFLTTLEKDDAASDLFWAITLAGTDRTVGAIDARLAGHRVELGWVLARRLWGRGLMTEAVRGLGDWLFARAGVERVWAVCDVDNLASRRVMEKAGLEIEGVLRRWSVHPAAGPGARDCYVGARVRDASARG